MITMEARGTLEEMQVLQYYLVNYHPYVKKVTHLHVNTQKTEARVKAKLEVPQDELDYYFKFYVSETENIE